MPPVQNYLNSQTIILVYARLKKAHLKYKNGEV